MRKEDSDKQEIVKSDRYKRNIIKPTKTYFIGIGGIGMSALARFILSQGSEVYGYDKTRTSLTKKLEDEGMKIHYEDDPNLIPKGVEVVVYTPAIPDSHKELTWLRERGYKVMKRAEMLGAISKSESTIAVAGTHGKTSTSSLIAHLLADAAYYPTAFVGGIIANYESNYMSGEGEWIVLEADEFDRSFLWLSPNISIVMSMDPDHLDIYGKHDVMLDEFNKFIRLTEKGGTVILKYELLKKLSDETLKILDRNAVTITTFGHENLADFTICNIEVDDGKFRFDLQLEDMCLCGLHSNMPGRHNIENATAAIIASLTVGLNETKLRNGLDSFRGIKRRFEKVVETEDVVYIDDYAHHPTELRSAIGAARELYPSSKITGVFQPHLFSRTRDFADGFAEELDKLDELILLDIYPAREEPLEGITSELVLGKMKNENRSIVPKEELMDELRNRKIETLMTLGAGDIDLFVPQIKNWLEKKNN